MKRFIFKIGNSKKDSGINGTADYHETWSLSYGI